MSSVTKCLLHDVTSHSKERQKIHHGKMLIQLKKALICHLQSFSNCKKTIKTVQEKKKIEVIKMNLTMKILAFILVCLLVPLQLRCLLRCSLFILPHESESEPFLCLENSPEMIYSIISLELWRCLSSCRPEIFRMASMDIAITFSHKNAFHRFIVESACDVITTKRQNIPIQVS